MLGTTNVYESDLAVDQYLLFHYGTAEDQLPYSFGPREALFYPIRCVSDFLPAIGMAERALDLGCAVGRSTFELTRWAPDVLGIDLSHRFIAAANRVRETGRIEIRRLEEGELITQLTRELPPDIRREDCRFEIGDATNVPTDIGRFDVVLASNLIDRVKAPRALLESFTGLVNPGGHLILSSPYTWMEEFTPKSAWLGGRYRSAGHPALTVDGIRETLFGAFDLRFTKELPFLIREHARKFQWSVAQATVWQRK
ncbi:MAG: putative 4-mercaptohistidine N1-methyltransferase [Verrucomicrobia bacterium]|nr:putative 4-mercaptohistidine N1-methyltransferase [Verrucomicrobiota bacterium]